MAVVDRARDRHRHEPVVHEVGDLEIAFRRAGTGAPLVLLHGAVCDSRVWRVELESFAFDGVLHSGSAQVVEDQRGEAGTSTFGARGGVIWQATVRR